ncbi:proton-translocating transhydrogenase family protein [Psychrobacter pygoscelis]|uniref:proton-translocating transhydrogenase family protein n=1 Tax=Psychrobacter pygoscelis TaxID=2488563 RepID=UPI001F613104|nr:proton-translocating transhydrogenase family protein [Psychrobacter pygoscelis]
MAADGAVAATPFVAIFTIFILAIFVGYYVVWGVTPALHTPLMAVTNALSSIVIVGAMLQTVYIGGEQITATSLLGAFAVFLASINIFGGFAVTERMLAMFKPKDKKVKAVTDASVKSGGDV